MSLRLQAAADLLAIVSDTSGGFGWTITITDPSSHTAAITGLSTDIGQNIDPETGMLVSGRRASVALPIASLLAAGFNGLPSAVADSSKRPWVIRFNDVLGNAHSFIVKESNPDTAIGIVVCVLEVYRG